MAENNEIVIRISVEPPQAAAAPADDFTEVKGKEYTPSQLLRFAIHRAFDKEPTAEYQWEDYYKMRMQRIISVIDRQTGK